MNQSGTLTLEKFESTIANVLEVMSVGFESVDTRLDKMDVRLDKMDARFDKMDGRFDTMDGRFDKIEIRLDKMDGRLDKHDGLINLLIFGQENLLAETRDIKQRVMHLEDSMEEVQYSLAVLTKAEEKDAEASINHELRLQSLEKVNNIKAVSPIHLREIQA